MHAIRNERGLAANLLYLAENDFGLATAPADRPRLSFAAWTQYLLSQYATVKELVQAVKADQIQIVPVPFGPGGKAKATVHMAVSDASGDSAVIEYLKGKGAIVTVCFHLGRPKDGPEDKFSLAPCAERMGELLGQEVKLVGDCIGDEVKSTVDAAKEGDVIMLENTRFYKEEEKNEAGFVEKLAAPFDMFVNDAFGTAHRAHASTEGVTKFLQPSVSGFLLAKELEYLDGAIENGKKPMAAIVGGSKVSSKITVLNALLDKVRSYCYNVVCCCNS